jgi:acyl-CoA hydrolase
MTLIETILKKLKPKIDDMVAENIEWMEKNEKRSASKFDIEYVRMSVIHDMVKALEKYTDSSDKLVRISASGSPKGSIELSMAINRKGVEYPLYTEVIYAGGHNIQRLHYRYITKTKIPQTGNSSLTKALDKKMKVMNNDEKIKRDINRWVPEIEKLKVEVEKNKKISRKEVEKIVKSGTQFRDISWAEIVKRGAAKNYNNSEKEFNKERQEDLEFWIESWYKHNISSKERRIVDLSKEVQKLKSKLSTSY